MNPLNDVSPGVNATYLGSSRHLFFFWSRGNCLLCSCRDLGRRLLALKCAAPACRLSRCRSRLQERPRRGAWQPEAREGGEKRRRHRKAAFFFFSPPTTTSLPPLECFFSLLLFTINQLEPEADCTWTRRGDEYCGLHAFFLFILCG